MGKRQFFSAIDIDIYSFQSICSQDLDKSALHFNADIINNVPVYEGRRLLDIYLSKISLNDLKSELNCILQNLSGAIIIKDFFVKEQTQVIDESNDIYFQIISEEKKIYTENRDFFSAKGKTDKLRNAFGKLCLNKGGCIFFILQKSII